MAITRVVSTANTIRSFKDLIVWQRSIDLSVEVYALTKSFPRDELFGLTSQLRRSSVSVSSNIAEGHSRRTTGEYIPFLCIARGSNEEVRSQLVLSQRLELGDQQMISMCENTAMHVSRMLNALIASLHNPSVH